MKEKAFTLAEVLITLTIIGIIAAITIPNLMQSWRKHERITQIKTAYSIIQNAVKMAVAENGPADSWDYNGGSDVAKYLLPYLKVQYVCGGYNTTTKGCFLTSTTNPNGYVYYLKGVSNEGSQAGYGANYYYTVKLQNGMDLGIFGTAKANQGTGNYSSEINFYVDVNGSQGPTKLGVDVFSFSFYPNINKVVTTAPVNFQGSSKWQDMLTTNYNGGCNLTAGQSGTGCTRVIELNHWEFPDNYPVKKF